MLDFGSPTGVRTSATCNSLLRELQQIWDDIGETEAEKDKMLMELEKECMDIYRRKFDEATNAMSRLRQAIASKEAELATLMAALGEHKLHSQIQSGKRITPLKEQLAAVTPLLDDLRSKKDERVKKFANVKAEIDKISLEISEYCHLNSGIVNSLHLDEQDLSLRRLTEFETHLRSLQKEKSARLNKVLDYISEVHSLCGVLGLDFCETVRDVHPSLQNANSEQSTNISDKTLQGLEQTITKLKSERKSRVEKLKVAMSSLYQLWNLMDTPEADRIYFLRLASVLRFSEHEITEKDALSMDVIDQASSEVERLAKLKASRMKELVMKRRSELEELCRRTHVEPDTSTSAEKSNAMIDSGLVDPSELLANIEDQISKVKEDALSRKDIMERIDRWLSVCEEENWLEEYNRDDNRYTAVRGSHLNLKRAERARVAVTKIPAMVDNLIIRTLAWEDEKRTPFLYDGVRLVSILEDYKLSRRHKEEEKKRSRDQKKLHDLLLTEKEAIYGSKPSPRKSNSFRKPNGYRANGNGSMTPTPRRKSAGSATPELSTPRSYSGNHNGYFKETRRLTTAPLNFVAMAKEDTLSYASISGSEPGSPPVKT